MGIDTVPFVSMNQWASNWILVLKDIKGTNMGIDGFGTHHLNNGKIISLSWRGCFAVHAVPLYLLALVPAGKVEKHADENPEQWWFNSVLTC